jgi:hypothetical protein
MNARELDNFDDWESRLKVELADAQKQHAEAEHRIRLISKKLDLVKQMRALELNPDVREAASDVQVEGSERRATPQNVKENVRKILSESNRPLHISEIHRRFAEAGYPIPGGGTPFNILAHLVNDKGFVRVARGTYALAGSVSEEQVMPKSPRRKRTRPKRVRNRSNQTED